MLKKAEYDLNQIALIIFVLALLVGFFVRLHIISNMEVIHHDDSISYLVAAGKQLVYPDAPFGELVSVSVWKDLLKPDKFLPLSDISTGLITYDLHPPLYFWLLHVVIYLTHDTLFTGPLLNLIFELILLGILFCYATALFKYRWKAYLVCAVWVLGSGTLDATLATRQYTLYSLFTILYMYLTFIWFYDLEVFQFKPKRSLVFALCASAGMLTHYYFALIIVASLIAITVRSVMQKDRRIVIYFLSLLGGALLFLIAFPQIFLYFDTLSNRFAPDFTQTFDFGIRLVTYVEKSFALFYTATPLFSYAFSGIVVLLAGILLIRTLIQNKSMLHLKSLWDLSKRHSAFLFWMIMWFTVVTIYGILYLSPNTPGWAIYGRYLQPIWDMMVFIPVWLITHRFRPNQSIVLISVILVLMGANLITMTMPTQSDMFQVVDEPIVSPVFINNESSGIVLPITNYLDVDQMVYVSWTSRIIENPANWLQYFQSHVSTYFESTRFEATRESNMDFRTFLTDEGFNFSPDPPVWGGTMAPMMYHVESD